TVTVSVGEAAAAWALVEAPTRARIEKRPMWFVCQLALNEPPGATVVLAVVVHLQPVSRPSRWISTGCPEALAGTLPLNWSRLRSRADSWLATVIPSPLAETVRLPGCTIVLGPALIVEGDSDDPPEDAIAIDGTASSTPRAASTT